MVAGMIMGASASSVWYNIRVRHPTKEVPIIDYDLALLFQPMLMLGITIGVALSVVFPYWLITVLIIILFMGLLKFNVTTHQSPLFYCSILLLFDSFSTVIVAVHLLQHSYFKRIVQMLPMLTCSCLQRVLFFLFIFFCLWAGTSSRSFCKGIEMWKEETLLKVPFYDLKSIWYWHIFYKSASFFNQWLLITKIAERNGHTTRNCG